ncbi:MAG TPA: RDD family protein [Pseudobdellovibrionaceae bacterium]|nr:RDD family protein [Pseudobdellovibrionaceae bacterium]
MAQDDKEMMYLPFADARKRGMIRILSAVFWIAAPIDSIGLAILTCGIFAFGGVAELASGKISSGLTIFALAAAAGWWIYYQYKLLQRGTSPFKKLFGMQVLKFDPELKAYRRCTPKEYVMRDILAMAYLPVPTAVLSIPIILGGTLAGGLSHATNGDDHGNPLVRQMNENRANAATAAGAAAGAAVSLKLIQSFPWLLAAHDTVMKTMVVNVTSNQAKYFEEGGLFETGEAIKPYSQAA